MIVLSKALIKKLETIVEPGYTVEITTNGGKVKVSRRPTEQAMIAIEPTLLSQDERVPVFVCARQSLEEPVVLADAIIPAGYYITGIMGGPTPKVCEE